MADTQKLVYVSEVSSVHADPKTGEVHYTCTVDGEEVHVIMDLYEAVHLHDKEHLKKCLIKYIKKL